MTSVLNAVTVGATVLGALVLVFFSSGPGDESRPIHVFRDMTLTEIHQEIEQTSERRTELWHILSQGHDPAAAAELKSLSERLDRLWDEERHAEGGTPLRRPQSHRRQGASRRASRARGVRISLRIPRA